MVMSLSYDGSAWNGWQNQNHGKTIQNCLERSIYKFTNFLVSITCSGRTDSGVHALNQIIHIDIPFHINLKYFFYIINSILPYSIKINSIKLINILFHARFSALSRTYIYILYNSKKKISFLDKYLGCFEQKLNTKNMKKYSKYLIGKNKFNIFEYSNYKFHYKSKIILSKLNINRYNNFVIFNFRANLFLHKMIRKLIFILIKIGTNKKLTLNYNFLNKIYYFYIKNFFSNGLYLLNVNYPEYFGIKEFFYNELKKLLFNNLYIKQN